MAFVHNPSHKYRKLSPKERKCIFIRYNEHSKGYVFIGKYEDGTVIELESQDVTFLKDDYPCTGEIDRDLLFFLMIRRPPRSTPEQQLMFESSGSELVLVAITVKESMLKKSSR